MGAKEDLEALVNGTLVYTEGEYLDLLEAYHADVKAERDALRAEREALKPHAVAMRQWLTNEEVAPNEDCIDAMWALVGVLLPAEEA